MVPASGLDGTLRLRLTGSTLTDPPLGTEWLVDAHGCEANRLRSQEALAALLDRIVQDLGLRTAGEPLWHVFPGPGGVTGILLLTESHLACHTFPERGFASFNLYCCRPHAEWPWPERLAESLGARRVEVRSFMRGRS
jgi:S-adenosylmethionine decarboxylase